MWSLKLSDRAPVTNRSFVTIHHGGWDMHTDIVKGLNGLCPTVDQAVGAFITDCRNRGLDQQILLVITGEFGRTPRINGNAGRDHWPQASTLVLAGGGLKMGQVVGETNYKGEHPKSDAVTPQDLMATIFHVLGIDPALHYEDQAGRPQPMLYSGKVIPGLT